MINFINCYKEKIDFFLSFLIMLVSLFLVIAEKIGKSQDGPNYCLILLAVIYVLFKILISKSNSNTKLHILIHLFWLALLVYFLCSSFSLGNITTFATASLAFISCDFLLGTGKESVDEKISRKKDTLTCLSTYQNDIAKPNTIRQELSCYKSDILKLRDIYQRITMDNCFEKNDREKFQKENQNFYKKLGYIDKKADELDKELYAQFYYNISNFINDQSDR